MLEHLPDCVFQDPTLMVGDLNARHDALGFNGSRNWNGNVWNQFLSDCNDVRLLGDNSPTHSQGGRIGYVMHVCSMHKVWRVNVK